MAKKDNTEKKGNSSEKNPLCGLIMPISAIPPQYTSEHWNDVKRIITEAVESIGSPKFNVKLVSDSDEVSVIQKSIVQNIYLSDIIVCDVSGKNPNVMFELGMRLTFDKPTVIIIDEITDFSFDTGVIEHLPYPSDLRYGKIVEFKAKLSEKVLATYRKAKEDENYSPFLKSFGQFKVEKLDEIKLPANELIISSIEDLRTEINTLRRSVLKRHPETTTIRSADSVETLKNRFLGQASLSIFLDDYFTKHPEIKPVSLYEDKDFYSYIVNNIKPSQYFKTKDEFIEYVDKYLLSKD